MAIIVVSVARSLKFLFFFFYRHTKTSWFQVLISCFRLYFRALRLVRCRSWCYSRLVGFRLWSNRIGVFEVWSYGKNSRDESSNLKNSDVGCLQFRFRPLCSRVPTPLFGIKSINLVDFSTLNTDETISICKEMGRINWTCSAPVFIIVRRIQGLNHDGRFVSLTELMPP